MRSPDHHPMGSHPLPIPHDPRPSDDKKPLSTLCSGASSSGALGVRGSRDRASEAQAGCR